MIGRIASCILLVVCCLGAKAIRNYCRSSSGEQYSLGASWEEGLKLCTCVYPESLVLEGQRKGRSDAIAHCLYNGCPVLAKEGESFINAHSDGKENCTCKKGTSMMLADSYTLYHGECSDGGDTHDIMFDY